MEVTGHIHAPASLFPRKEPPVPTAFDFKLKESEKCIHFDHAIQQFMMAS
jgi:hypothetical protein